MKIKFPDGFLWGTSTSAHQVEGNNHNNWTEWEKSEKRINSGIACDQYNRYEEDFDLAKSMNNNAHRFSVEWSRIEPEEGKFNETEIRHYRKLIQALRFRGIEPFVTLWHFTVPIWFSQKGGFEKRENIKYFVRYCERIAKELRHDVKFWITVNEPEIYSLNSYARGLWPPQKKSIIYYFRVNSNLAEAHKTIFKAIHSANPNAQVGMAKNNTYFEGWAAPIAKYLWNDYFLKKIKNHQDFIGLNYYFHNRIRGFRLNRNDNKRITDMGWEIYPKGIYYVLKDLKKYGKPVYITENGLADAKDEKRKQFISETLINVHRAVDEGTDVRGYFHWSLLDNFEWDKGFWPKFGLVEIDCDTLERKPRPSGRFYAEIAKSNAIEDNEQGI